MEPKKQIHAHESLSIWRDSITPLAAPKLDKDFEIDVCVIGGGISGMTTAYLLQKEGRNVCVLESREIGSGQTGKTCAHLSTLLGDRYYVLEKFHGADGAKLAADSHLEALDRVEQIASEENISCELERVDGYLFLGPHQSESILKRELEAIHRAGLTDVYRIDRAPIRSFDTGPTLCFPRQIQFHPLKYLNGLAKAFQHNGGKIYIQTHVIDMEGGPNAFVETSDGYMIKCNSIVVATNSPINDVFAIHSKQAPYRSYVLAAKIEKECVPKGLYWDTLDPYHYVRTQRIEADPDHVLLIVGGQDHKTGQDDKPEQNYLKLEVWMREHFPTVKEIVYRWSGQIMEPVDGLAYLGHNPMDRKNVYVITGGAGDGLTSGTIGGIIVSDQIVGRMNPWERIYQPARVKLHSVQNYFRENLNVVMQYADWFMEARRDNLEDIEPGEGTVFRSGLKIMAAYRNEEGAFRFLSAVCPHLGGIVRWNTTEKSWDCPCHGSRFDCEGRVIEGPALTSLKPVDFSFEEQPSPTPEVTVYPKTASERNLLGQAASRARLKILKDPNHPEH